MQRSRTWVNRMVKRCMLVILAGEELEADRARWGKTQVLQHWFEDYTVHVIDVPELMRFNGDEVGVVIKEGGS